MSEDGIAKVAAEATTPRKRQVSIRYTGPIPPPSDFHAYNSVLPGAAERILSLAESEAHHRREMDKEAARQNMCIIEGRHKIEGRGQVFAIIACFLAMSTSIVAIIYNQPTVAGAIGGTTVVGLVGAFVIGKVRRAPTSDKKRSRK